MKNLLDEATKYIGQKEVPGIGSNPWIVSLWDKAYGWLGKNDSQVAWCGLFMRMIAIACGYGAPSAPYRARSWLAWGYAVSKPVRGCVVVLERGGAGHVAIVDHIDANGNLGCVGGNQGDMVKLSYFPQSRVLGYRVPYPGYGSALQAVAKKGELSRNEA